MKSILRYITFTLLLGGLFSSCEKYNEPTPLTIQKPELKSAEYYANLRAYKLSNHQVSFGWFGGWSGHGPSMKSFMRGLPDSLDIISLWSGNPYTPESKADMDFVQNVKGTRVCACLLLGWTGKGLNNEKELEGTWPSDRKEALRLYADRLAQQFIADGYQGFDIDYEPYVGTPHDVRDCPVGEDFLAFVDQLGKYFGPKSGTNRLLIIDGELDTPPAECAPYFNYAVSQAYGRDASGCQNKYNEVADLFKPEQFIVTEDFEQSWQPGGQVLTHAAWHPTQGRKGGCGTYHMEYDYGNNPQYKWLRQAIQIMNPALVTGDGTYKPVAYINLNQKNLANVTVVRTPEGEVVDGTVEFAINCSREISDELTITLAQNNALIESYNLNNATFYEPAPEGLITITNNGLKIPANSLASTDKISIELTGDLSQIDGESNGYLLPIEIASVAGSKKVTTSRDRNVVYILIKANETNVKTASAVVGTAADRTGWVGDSDQEKNNISKLLDGSTGSSWPSSWAKPAFLTIDMTTTQKVKSLKYDALYDYYGYREIEIQTSTDGTTWTKQGRVTGSPIGIVVFYAPVSCRYIKTTTITSNDSSFFGLTEFNAYL